jgi:hypothetical protein
MFLPQKIGDQWMHSRGGKKHRGIVIRQQGSALDLGVAPGLEEFNVLGTQFVGVHTNRVGNLCPLVKSSNSQFNVYRLRILNAINNEEFGTTKSKKSKKERKS